MRALVFPLLLLCDTVTSFVIHTGRLPHSHAGRAKGWSERPVCTRRGGARGLAAQQGDAKDRADGGSDALFASLRKRQEQLEEEEQTLLSRWRSGECVSKAALFLDDYVVYTKIHITICANQAQAHAHLHTAHHVCVCVCVCVYVCVCVCI
jgi:hypothetical protein